MPRWQPVRSVSRYGLGVPAQRTRAGFAPDQRSAHPGIEGVPPWAAVVIAVSATLAGFAIEAGAGHSELGFIFAACYALGCIAAVLAVRHSGIFTAVIQPPLLLFVAVPFAYFMFHGSSFNGLKDVLITCGYPLIERFPLMLFTSAAVLVIGLGRWYFSVGRDHTDVPDADAPAAPGFLSGLTARVAAFTRSAGDEAPRHGVRRTAEPRRRPPADRAARPERSRRPERGEPTRSRHARPPREDEYDAPRPRRQPARGSARDADPRDRPRRPREAGPRESNRRTPPPQRREPRERGRERDNRYDPYPPPGRGYESYRDPYDYRGEPPRRRPAPESSRSAHHPVSGVRYRGDAPEDRPRR